MPHTSDFIRISELKLRAEKPQGLGVPWNCKSWNVYGLNGIICLMLIQRLQDKYHNDTTLNTKKPLYLSKKI